MSNLDLPVPGRERRRLYRLAASCAVAGITALLVENGVI